MQTLIEHNVEGIVVGEDEEGNLVGNCTLGCRMCESIANTLDFPLFHTKEARSNQIRICVQDLTISPSFQRLVDMNILVAQQQLCGNGLIYGLANHFAKVLPPPPRFNVPEPAFCYMYPKLNENTSKEFSKGDEKSP